MRTVLLEAQRGLGRTSPNPAVGCVIVKNRRIVATGHHRKAGKPHAEIEALAVAKDRAAGGTLYVNLEPCCHTGRTGPCTEAILAAGVREVVVGMLDPNPVVNGRGVAILKKAGVKVRLGILKAECEQLNEPFVRWVTSGRPHVTLKAAVSLDGRIAPAPGVREQLTGAESMEAVHAMRDASDAVLVGVGTVLADDPLLTTRRRGGRTARRVILDAQARTPPASRVLTPVAGAAPTTIFVTEHAPKARVDALRAKGAEVHTVPPGDAGGVDLHAVLLWLGKSGALTLMVEGGAAVFDTFLAKRLVDRMRIFVAPKILGGAGVPLVATLTDSLALENVVIERLGDDVVIGGRTRFGEPVALSTRKRAP